METAQHRPSPPPFAQALRQFRLDRRLTQEQLAELAGMSVRTVRNAETGRVGVPRLQSIARLADALRLSPEDQRRLKAGAGSGRPLPPASTVMPQAAHDERPPAAPTVVHLEADSPVLLVIGRAGVIEMHLATRRLNR